MHIELLLSSVNQDQASNNTAEAAFFGWRHGPSSGTGSGNGINDYPKISIRQESWGSVFVYMPTQTVYWTDVEALVLLERLASGECLQDIKTRPNGVPESNISEFERLLNKFNIAS